MRITVGGGRGPDVDAVGARVDHEEAHIAVLYGGRDEQRMCELSGRDEFLRPVDTPAGTVSIGTPPRSAIPSILGEGMVQVCSMTGGDTMPPNRDFAANSGSR